MYANLPKNDFKGKFPSPPISAGMKIQNNIQMKFTEVNYYKCEILYGLDTIKITRPKGFGSKFNSI